MSYTPAHHALPFLVGLLLISLTLGGWVSEPGQAAGRIWHIGDTLSDSLLVKPVWADDPALSPRTTILLLFTRSDQHYSERIFTELDRFLAPVPRDTILPVHLHRGTPFTENEVDWISVPDPHFDHYSQFGLKVYPTVMLVSSTGVLLAYFPGFNQGFIRHLNDFLSAEYVTLFHRTDTTVVSRQDKRQKRRESLAMELYLRGKHQLALIEISKLDTLTVEDRILLGYALIQNGQDDSARTVFSGLAAIDSSNFVLMGLGILAYESGDYVTARDYFTAVTTMKDMYRVHFWRGLVYEKLGDVEQAKSEFKKSARQIRRRIKTTFLP